MGDITYKNKMLLSVFIILLLNSAVLFFYQSSKFKDNLESKISYMQNIIEEDFNEKILDTQKEYSVKMDIILNIPGVKEAFASQDREKLYSLIYAKYTNFKDLDPFLKIMTFRLPDGSTFLRVHKPEMYGDALNKKRKIIIDTNEKKKRLFGFEIGKLKMSYRIVTPIFHDNKYIGLVETGVLTEKFTKNISSLFHLSHALMVKTEDTQVLLDQKKYTTQNQFTLISNDPMFKDIFYLSFKENKNKRFFIYKNQEGSSYAIQNKLNLLNQNKEVVAKILVADNITKFQNNYNTFIKETIISILLVSIIILFLLHISFNDYITKLEKSKEELQIKVLEEMKLSSQLNRSIRLFGENVISVNFDANGIITYVSPAFIKISGYTEMDLLGQPYSTLLHHSMENGLLQDMWSTLKNGETWKAEVKNRKKNAEHYWLTCSVLHKFDKNNNLIGYTAINHDITAQKAKDEFMSNMSHELRTPLNAILGFSTILMKKHSDPTLADMAKQIHTSSESLLKLINDILDLAKIQNSNFAIRPFEFHAYDAMLEFIHQFEGLTHKKRLHFKTSISDDLKSIFYADLTRINQISLNLISNAVKFTPQDGEITFSAQYKNNALVISISDNGIGMSQEVQNKIFKPFEQADGSTTRKYGGTGLGLSITQNLVELMLGHIELESQEGKGTTFTVTLPLKKCTNPQVAAKVTMDETDEKENTLSGHILIAEDNKTNQMLIRMLIEDFGLSCDIANDGLEVIDLYNPDKHRLILMDENMPNMSGLEAMKVLHDKYKKQCCPIIALTANAMEGDKDKFLSAGMDDYLAKPIDEDKLYATLVRFL